MRELKYIYIVEWWREGYTHTEYEFIDVFRSPSKAKEAKQNYCISHNISDPKEVKVKKRILR